LKKQSKPARAAKQPRPPRPSSRKPASVEYVCEVHVAIGLESIAIDELKRRFLKHIKLRSLPENKTAALRYPYGVIRFAYTGDLRALLQLQTALSVYLVQHFPVPRPKALLGDEHFRLLLAQIAVVRALLPARAYTTFHLSAAGSDSAVMRRLSDEIAERTGLKQAANEGDLQIALRRPAGGAEGWELFLRLSPRPLATRAWRVCNFHGALNATVAHAMAVLTRPRASDVFLNLACGSGTLLIERLAAAPAQRLIGCDSNAEVLECARQNIEAAGAAAKIELYDWDARALPLPDHSIDTLSVDLPFGNLVGTHSENLSLYPAILAEAARVARPGARFVVISHEVRLMEDLLAPPSAWQADQIFQVTLGGLNPRIFVLRRANLGRPAHN
jgi:ubiquinone/menaquinone biosynthesis C-methylase UbiE